MNQAQIKQRNLHMRYINYKKGFDSVPQVQLLVLRIYKIKHIGTCSLEISMQNWHTSVNLKTGQTNSVSQPWAISG